MVSLLSGFYDTATIPEAGMPVNHETVDKLSGYFRIEMIEFETLSRIMFEEPSRAEIIRKH
jgi:hypothetical protein